MKEFTGDGTAMIVEQSLKVTGKPWKVCMSCNAIHIR